MNTYASRGKTILLITLSSLFFCTFTKAQETFRLSDYKNPDYHWKRLDVNFDLGGNHDHSFFNQEMGSDTKSSLNNFSGGLNVSYLNLRNSTHYQGQQVFKVNGFAMRRFNREEEDGVLQGDEEKQNFENISLNIGSDNRFYNDKKQFFEIDYDIYGLISHNGSRYSSDLEDLPYNTKDKSMYYQSSASVNLLLGLGRIEDVQDARLAVYILDDLDKTGDLVRKADNKEVLEFAQFITKLKNRRSFDSRIRKIEEITAIDSFLTVRGLRAQSDASYFTTINDDWDYASGPVRATGGRFSFGVSPRFEYGFQLSKEFYIDTAGNAGVIEEYSNEYKVKNHAWGLDGLVAYDWERPASLYLQHAIRTEARYALYHEKRVMESLYQGVQNSDYVYRLDSPNLNISVEYAFGYYPNSRTSFEITAYSMYGQYWGETSYNDEPYDVDRKALDTGIGLNCYYYISPQLRLRLILDGLYAFENRMDYISSTDKVRIMEGNLQMNYSITLTYSIF